MNKIRQQIKEQYNDLTQSLKIAANFILDNPKLVALYPAKEIGRLSETSETTVIRLCYALGYSGYSSLQEEIRKTLLLPVEEPFQALKKGIEIQENVISHVVEQDIKFIKKTFEEIDERLFLEAVKSMISAKKIVIVGLKGSYGAANWLAYSLNIVRGNTILYKGDIDDANYLLTEMTEEWLIIALSFPRYVEQTISFVKASKEKGAKILSITDHELSPVGVLSDITLKVMTQNPTGLKGMPVITSVLNALVSGVMVIDKKNVVDRVDKYNQTSEHYYTFHRLD
ncbi:MurR/RpiR family transcriptional regulator [Bacillus litorisediminis]|uniref:MurR/RpiR family transcriptional regulator n=1 Tax=Bacillus litorisediminis TaxID=2922713 RepID=UPI001FADEC5C|nr:MurR/RpiR family transcriptional regulator [Bacillus litorisediminis]